MSALRLVRVPSALLAGLLIAFAVPAAHAQDEVKTPWDDKMGITQKLGGDLPLGLEFTDETGAKVKLGDFYKDRPVLLVPVFYTCKSACLLTRDGVLQVLNRQKKLKVGQDFDVVVFSIKPDETTKMAADAKKAWTDQYRYGGAEASWHFLTGDEVAIQSLTTSIGFKFTYDKAKDLVVHPTCIVFTSSSGTVSYYQEGVNYAAKEFMTAMGEAKQNVVGEKSEAIRFPACYAYDPKTGKVRVAVENVLFWLGLVTVAVLGGSIVHMSMKYRQSPASGGSGEAKGGSDDEASGNS